MSPADVPNRTVQFTHVGEVVADAVPGVLQRHGRQDPVAFVDSGTLVDERNDDRHAVPFEKELSCRSNLMVEIVFLKSGRPPSADADTAYMHCL